MSRVPRNGFSLAEFLVVLAIIGIAIGLMLPATRRVRESAARIACQNNLKQLMLGFHNYESMGQPAPDPSTGHRDEHGGRFFPPGCLGPGTTPEERLSWMVALLPYVEQDAVFQFDVAKGYAGNLPAAQTLIRTFVCPASEEAAGGNSRYERRLSRIDLTNYVAMAGLGRAAADQLAGTAGNGFMGHDRLTSFALIKDGASNTIALLETGHDLGPWARGGGSTLRGFDPADGPLHGEKQTFGIHTGLIQAAMVDGSVRSIRSSIDPKKLAAAITIAGGERVELD
jgi:prepilin-type N-terminal cleavage/methylation domain-containing protein